jgi:hypothetical protein
MGPICNPWWLVRPGPTTEPSYLNGQGGRPTTNTPPVFRETSVVGPAGTNHRTPPKEPTTTLDPALKHNLLVVGGPFGGVRWLARPGPTTEVSLKTGGVLVVGRPPKRTNNQFVKQFPSYLNGQASLHWLAIPGGWSGRDQPPNPRIRTAR